VAIAPVVLVVHGDERIDSRRWMLSVLEACPELRVCETHSDGTICPWELLQNARQGLSGLAKYVGLFESFFLEAWACCSDEYACNETFFSRAAFSPVPLIQIVSED
jgi:hypothetical protein